MIHTGRLERTGAVADTRQYRLSQDIRCRPTKGNNFHGVRLTRRVVTKETLDRLNTRATPSNNEHLIPPSPRFASFFAPLQASRRGSRGCFERRRTHPP